MEAFIARYCIDYDKLNVMILIKDCCITVNHPLLEIEFT